MALFGHPTRSDECPLAPTHAPSLAPCAWQGGRLRSALQQEKAADKKLSGLAEGGVNRRATGRAASKTPARRAAASSATVKRKTAQAKRRVAAKKKSTRR